MDIILKVLMIIFSIVFIIDYTDFVEESTKFLYEKITKMKWTGKTYKPFSCSLCMSFWLVVIYLLYRGFNLIDSVFFSCISSYCTQYVNFIIYKLKL